MQGWQLLQPSPPFTPMPWPTTENVDKGQDSPPWLFLFAYQLLYTMRPISDRLRNRGIIAILLLMVLCLGCTQAPLAPSTWDRSAADFIPAPGRSNIFVFREEVEQGKSQLVPIFLDGRFMGEIAAGNFLLSETPPGFHSIAAFSHVNQDSVNLRVEEGKNYFLEIGGSGMGTFPVTIRQVEEEAGRQGVLACQRGEGRRLFP